MFLKCFPCRWDPILLANCSDSFDGLQGIKFKGEMGQNMIPRLAKSSNLWIFHKTSDEWCQTSFRGLSVHIFCIKNMEKKRYKTGKKYHLQKESILFQGEAPNTSHVENNGHCGKKLRGNLSELRNCVSSRDAETHLAKLVKVSLLLHKF